MRFMVIVKATQESEAGKMPSTELLEAMGKYNEELVNAGVLLAGDGLHPSSKGARVKFSGNKRTVIDGPFAETKELIAGYWLWQCKSKEEAVEWAKRCPNPAVDGKEGELEIRQVFEADDFGAEFTPELREQEQRVFEKAERLQKRRNTVTPESVELVNMERFGMADVIHRLGIKVGPEKVFRALSAASPKESIIGIGIELGSDSSMKGNANG